MDQNFEQNIPMLPLVLGFLFLLFFSYLIRNNQRKKVLVREGQLYDDSNRIHSVEERVAGNKIWASGKIPSGGRGIMFGTWLIAIVWMLTFGVSFVKSLSNPDMKTSQQIVLGVFALLGLAPIYFAIRFTKRWLCFGQSWCFINGKAGVLSKTISGYIRTTNEIMPTGDYLIELLCVETYHTGTGKNRKSHFDIKWQGKQTVPFAGQSSRAGIPFSFNLPPYPPETGYQLSRGSINWQLQIKAPAQGIEYVGMFIVPVFKIDET